MKMKYLKLYHRWFCKVENPYWYEKPKITKIVFRSITFIDTYHVYINLPV